METQKIMIDDIPVMLWGPKSDKIIVAVHGDMSNKADAPVEILSEVAVPRGYRVISFDLPEHGDRKGSPAICDLSTCTANLKRIMKYAHAIGDEVGVFACSMGAFFSLMSYADEELTHCLFLSPVVNMYRLICNMMQWFNVTEEMLYEQKTIPTPIGKILYWDYYSYVKEHPVMSWPHHTNILYGSADEISERAMVDAFVERFGCDLQIYPGGEHYFHTPQQLATLREWFEKHI